MDSFAGKVAVITGAASGIGAALAEHLARSGASLVLADKSALTDTERTVREAGAPVMSVTTDVANRKSVDALADMAYEAFGAVHLLCNNAGVVLFGPIIELTEAEWDWILSVNLKGVINGVAAFLPRMIEQGEGERHILITASGAGLVASGAMPLGAYTTSKFAVVGYAESLRHEFADTGIGVTILCPGSVQTGILDRAQYTAAAAAFRPKSSGGVTPSREGIRRMQPSVVAELALDGVRRDMPYVLTHPESFDSIRHRFSLLREASNHTAARLGLAEAAEFWRGRPGSETAI